MVLPVVEHHLNAQQSQCLDLIAGTCRVQTPAATHRCTSSVTSGRLRRRGKQTFTLRTRLRQARSCPDQSTNSWRWGSVHAHMIVCLISFARLQLHQHRHLVELWCAVLFSALRFYLRRSTSTSVSTTFADRSIMNACATQSIVLAMFGTTAPSAARRSTILKTW